MEISPELLQRIDAILRKQIGLNAESLGGSGIATALAHRIGKLGMKASDEYVERVLAESTELQQLIESVVVPETWFFRDMTPFRCIQQVARQQVGSRFGRPLRVLSIPCSTGEEPYSVAVTLLASGLSPQQFSIDAVDISERSLARAAEGHYGATSFREKHPDCHNWQKLFFHMRGDRFHVCDEARQRVTFRHGNLVSTDFLAGTAAYDLVLCRNLLIYFDGSARQSAMKNLKRLLATEGVLYSGHAEAAAFADAGFRSFDKQFPFAFRHATNAQRATVDMPLPFMKEVKNVVARRPENRVAPKPASRIKETSHVGKLSAVVSPKTHTQHAPSFSEQLQAARRTADQGRLSEALRVVEPLTKQHPTNAEAWCLLGILQQATGQNELAERSFERAIYIDPRHEESLIHLSLLCQLRGDADKAARYRKRIG